MRKALMWVGGGVLVAGVAVSGGWLVLAPAAKAQVEEIVADLKGQGIDFSYDSLEISGFPFRFDAEFESLRIVNERNQLATTMPTATGSYSPLSPSSVVIEFPETMQFALMAQTTMSLIDVTSEELSATLTAVEGDGLDYDISAETLRVAPGLNPDPAAATKDHVTFDDIQIFGRLDRDAAGAPQAIDVSFDAARAVADVTLVEPNGAVGAASMFADEVRGALDATDERLKLLLDAEKIALEARGEQQADMLLDGIALNAAITPQQSFGLARAFEGAEPGEAASRLAALVLQAVLDGGAADVALDIDAYSVTSTVDSPDYPVDALSIGGSDSRNTMTIAGDLGTFASSARAVTIQTHGENAFAGGAKLARLETSYPLKAAVGVIQTANVSYELADLTLDDATWAEIDPTGSLPREMPGLKIDTRLGLEVLEDALTFAPAAAIEPPPQVTTQGTPQETLQEMQEETPEEGAPSAETGAAGLAETGAAPATETEPTPVALRSLDLDTLTLELLAFRADANGSLEFEDEATNGVIEVTLANWRKLFDDIGRAGLVDPGQLMIAAITLEGFARNVDETTSSLRVEFNDGVMAVNGRAFGG